MKLLFTIILVLAVFIIGYFMLRTYRERHKLSDTVGIVLYLGLAMVFFNMIALLTETKDVYLLMYSGYFIASDWLFYYLLYFSIEFIGNDFDKYVRRKFICVLLFADSLSVGMNNVFGHLFDAERVTLFDNEQFFQLVLTPYFLIHYVIVLMMVVLCLISLMKKVIQAAVFYRRKYAAILLCIMIIAVLNFFSLRLPLDFSVVGYVLEAVCIYYCTFVYTPQRLLPKTLLQVAKGMEIGLFVMDVDGNELYSNHFAKMLLGVDQPVTDKKGVPLSDWCRDKYMNSKEVFSREQIFYRGEEELTIKIQLQRMMDSRKQLQGGYFTLQDRTEEINKMKREHYLATHNTLTDMYNKEYFYEQAEKLIKQYPDTDMLMICTDIKEFKMVNDFLGTQIGDVVLKNIANMIKSRVPDAMIQGHLGNDIFAVLVAKEDFDENVMVFRDQESFFAGIQKEISFPVLNYVGIYEIKNRQLPVSVMCDRARMAISKIKGDYHKRVAYYDNELREDVLYEQELIGELETAIQEGQLKMFLQPQIAAGGSMIGAEALVKWIHPVKGMISPGEFIPVFERNGLISDVDRCIWEQACKQLKKWKLEGRADLYISVNISPKDLYFLNIYQIFTDLVKKYDISPKNIKLEITETAIAMDFKRQLELITKLREAGFVVEMDDFGSGYSSLNMLKDIQVDIIKIDMAFLRKANDEARSRKILEMIISLSKQLGMTVVTEGVEMQEQVDFLTKMGCDVFQGYYFGRPMEVEQFEQKYSISG